MEKDDEVRNGKGNSYDFGARMLDPRIGRWLSVDALEKKYTSLSPYNFVANTPLQAKDPDGRIIIFINGLYGPIGGVNEPKARYWGSAWRNQLKRHWNDQNYLFLDGSLGGQANIPANLSADYRQSEGYEQGYNSAQTIIDNLSDGETIKYVTNSMGAAFQRGFSNGLNNYINDRKVELYGDISTSKINISDYQTEMEDLFNEDGSYNSNADFNRAKKLDGLINMEQQNINNAEKEISKLNSVVTEIVVDIEPFQKTKVDPYAKNHYYVIGDKSKNSGFENMLNIEPVEGAKDVSKKNGKSITGSHHNYDCSPSDLPKP